MKLILSRKGFDSAAGGVASPILPDGKLLSLPIPGDPGDIPYQALSFCGQSVASIIINLTGKEAWANKPVHLDPDIYSLINHDNNLGWRPIFGQGGAAQTHLKNNNVGVGDIFLFFGWFRQTTYDKNGNLCYKRDSLNLHVIYGWLQIGAVLSVHQEGTQIPVWAMYHPHMQRPGSIQNTLYVANEKLFLPGLDRQLSGAGVFEKYSETLQLTEKNSLKRCSWRLPNCFFPIDGRSPLTYHSNPELWQKDEIGVKLKSMPRGQEFVLDIDEYPEVLGWLKELFENNTNI